MARYLYSELSSLLQARRNCARISLNSPECFKHHTETIERLVDQHLPSGSGFDSGTKLDLDASREDKLVFVTSFHHMNQNGFYDGWTEHTVTVTPSLSDRFHLRVSGRNRNDVKDYIHESFDVALRTDVTYDLYLERFPQFAISSKWEDKDGGESQCYQAWYVDGQRFWQDFNGAREYAAKRMTEAL